MWRCLEDLNLRRPFDRATAFQADALPLCQGSILVALSGGVEPHGYKPRTVFEAAVRDHLTSLSIWRSQSDSNRRSQGCNLQPYQLGYGIEK